MKNLILTIVINIILYSCSTEVKRYSLEDTIKKNQLVYLENDMLLVNGIVYLKNLNNILIKEITYIDGKKEGLEISWYENGQLDNLGQYNNGEKDGIWKYYYENSQLQSERNYNNGKEDGIWKMWDLYGQLKYELHYKNGKKKLLKSYDGDGQLKSEFNYKDNKIFDPLLFY